MNIQPSVMVWTVICFLILTVILKNLLFTPLLKIMDSRREKIQAASKKKEDIEKCILEHKNQAEKEKTLAEEKTRKETKQKLEQLQLQGKKEIETAQRQCIADVQKYREGITDEHDKIVYSVAPKMETAAALFAKNIISHRI
ncbi:MAG: ATP synthase F0 subunit B [Clostridia bacterium]|nr:ATP synthase F0 subunit B [Clostridia bacterium]